jgi:Rne/Rng family ribonuclease
MSKELVVSTTSHETRVAVLEDDLVVEVFFQRENEYSLAGSIHKGRVTRVLPGMQSAFVDIGLERDAFLYVSDFFEDNEEYEKVVSTAEDQALKLNQGGTAPAAVPPAAPALAEPVQQPVAAPTAVSESTVPAAGRTEDRDGRDRRGRRSRRRRGGPGGQGGSGGRGRGLPESKFYSPSPRGETTPPPSAPTSTPVAAGPVEDEDLMVLPGESLAKYRGEPSASSIAEPAEIDEPVEPAEPQAEAAEAPPQTHLEPLLESVAETAVGPVAEIPEPEPAPLETSAHEPELAAVLEPEAETPAELVDDDTEQPSTVEAEASEAEAEKTQELTAEGGETELAEAAPVAEEEGPEPARIPTSLTATLREQGPRYMHRISRRMRRKGRGGPEPQRRPEQEPGAEQPRVVARPEPRPEKTGAPSISDLLREGQEIIVQIAKEPLGQKGARITSHIALPGRFLVYMPTVDHIGVSRRIATDEERARLKRVLQTHRTGIPGGYIVRTAGEGRTEEELRADMMFLYNLWLDLRQKAEKKPAPALVHHDLDVVQRVLRDQLTSQFKNVWVDNDEIYENVVGFVQRFQPSMVSRVKLYTRPTPIFDEFNVTSELEKALRPKVWLKSGGYIVINQTEALVAIDVNTGKFVGKSNRLEDTIVKTNTDAIREIVRQIRLRDLGGIIVVDFIDMDERKNRQKVMQALEEAMRADRAPYKILQFNDFGLVAITRKRVKQSLERTLCAPCPYCEGAGYVKSVGTVIGEILQEAHKIARAVEGPDVMLRVHPEVAKSLKSNQNTFLQELEEILGRNVIVKGDAMLHQEKFDLA